MSNAWPERGASALKNTKTRHRNRIQNDLLDALLQVTVNGPKCEDAGELVKRAVCRWMTEKERRKLAVRKVRPEKETVTAATTDAGVQTDEKILIGQVQDEAELRQEITAALKRLEIGERMRDHLNQIMIWICKDRGFLAILCTI